MKRVVSTWRVEEFGEGGGDLEQVEVDGDCKGITSLLSPIIIS